jgi:hypothetical protein
MLGLFFIPIPLFVKQAYLVWVGARASSSPAWPDPPAPPHAPAWLQADQAQPRAAAPCCCPPPPQPPPSPPSSRAPPAALLLPRAAQVGVMVAYLFTFIPEWTAWILLVAMALYDLAAVLCPGGPLKVGAGPGAAARLDGLGVTGRRGMGGLMRLDAAAGSGGGKPPGALYRAQRRGSRALCGVRWGSSAWAGWWRHNTHHHPTTTASARGLYQALPHPLLPTATHCYPHHATPHHATPRHTSLHHATPRHTTPQACMRARPPQQQHPCPPPHPTPPH